MGFFIDGDAGLPCTAATLDQLKTATSALGQRILALLAAKPRYAYELAQELGVHEQKVYYHVRRMERAGLVTSRAGERRYYEAAQCYALPLRDAQPLGTLRPVRHADAELLHPFIADGEARFTIVVGSHDPHGPRMAQGRDGSYAIDLALLLGSYLAARPRPVVKLDTEFRDWKRNLIIVGGPIVNTAAEAVNDALPIRFLQDGKRFVDARSGETYDHDETGVIVKTRNPRSPDHALLFVAGRSKQGTKAAILALTTRFDELAARHADGALAVVVEGTDEDNDGVVDAVRIL